MVERLLLVLSALVNATFCVSIADAKSSDRDEIEYACSDLVVVGRLVKQDYQHVEIEDDILGHGWVTADVKVDYVVHGPMTVNKLRVRKLPVRYFAHTYMREDRDFVFVLRPAENGRHLVRKARLMEYDPELANRCS
ncbi:MAG: hypothetical protein ACJ8FC_01945 [Sphingomicrobium sp.]